MSNSEIQDNILFELLKECKTLPNFLDQIFGFLQRRTDFYHVANELDAVVGLPEGLAEKLVRYSFYKWKPQIQKKEYSEKDIPIAEEEIIVPEIEHSEPTVSEVVGATKKVGLNHDCPFTDSESYNGSKFDNYCWSQTIAEIDLIIKIPDKISRKDLLVTIHPCTISLKTRQDGLIFDGELFQKCKANEAVWSIDDNKLLIHLEKCQEIWWKCLVKGEKELDISKIDCSRSYDELPEEAQSKIEELQWNQERKKLGLPTSEELALNATLKKAWNVNGSPFSGPFDPSTVKFS
ncbi:unnamed protein product [Phaedon cochleariae]|uniref:Nuclear migration protein nudC n=1 Tax=Phaedon cochleariae TaxID=80249 RepID=A0A9N9SCC4_PHACE|nr:unnamed protein product [Phaedon cochleariae]